jgi:hypothetical protein
LIILTIFGEACKLWSPSLSSLLHSPATTSFLDSNILLSTLFSNTLHLRKQLKERR